MFLLTDKFLQKCKCKNFQCVEAEEGREVFRRSLRGTLVGTNPTSIDQCKNGQLTKKNGINS